MKFTYDMDASSLIQRIQERTEPLRSPLILRFHPKRPNAVLCSVDHNRIRLMKSTPHKRTTQRVFSGRICVEGEKTIISGRFVFEAIDIIFLLLAPLGIILVSIFDQRPHILKWEDIGLSILFFIMEYIMMLILTILFYHKEETTVREFLESL